MDLCWLILSLFSVPGVCLTAHIRVLRTMSKGHVSLRFNSFLGFSRSSDVSECMMGDGEEFVLALCLSLGITAGRDR